jgi:hypothetical protein
MEVSAMACFDAHGNPYPRFVPPPRPQCAARHHMPTNWKASGFDARGYERLVCIECGRFIGYRDPKNRETKPAKE